MADPYRSAFDCALHLRDNDSDVASGTERLLSVRQWEVFVQSLVDSKLLQPAPAERLLLQCADEPPGRSFAAFQRSLLGVIELPECCARVTETLAALSLKTDELRHALQSGTLSSSSADATHAHDKFLRAVMMREGVVREQIESLEREAADTLVHQRLEHELFGTSDFDSSSNSTHLMLGSPWDFQSQNAPFILAHEHSDAWSDSVQVDLIASEREHERALQASMFPATLLRFGADIRAAFGSVPHRQQEAAAPQERTMSSVLVIERDRAAPDAVAWLDTLVYAHRQLSLSPYFPHLLGIKELAGGSSTDSHSDGATTLVCFEYMPATSLDEVLRSDGVFDERSVLFRFYVRELVLALTDLLEQSTHTLRSRVGLENVMISHSARSLFLAKLDFGDAVDPFKRNVLDAQTRRECALLEDLALVLFAMLYGATLPNNTDDLRTQYLERKQQTFCFAYTVEAPRGPTPLRRSLCVSRGDRFQLTLDSSRREIWHLTRRLNRGDSGAATCVFTERLTALTRFTFDATRAGETTLRFAARDASGEAVVEVALDVRASNYRLESGSVQSLIRFCASGGQSVRTLSSQSRSSSETSVARPSPLKLLLQRHELLQPLSPSDQDALETEIARRAQT